MEITLEQQENAYGIIKLDVATSDYMPEVNKKLKDYSRKAVLKGFRPGKVPFGLINKMYGKQLRYEVINDTINKSVSNYIEEEKVPVIFSPILKSEPITEDDFDQKQHHLEFEVFINPKPDVVLDDTLKATAYKANVSDEEVDNTINNLKKNYPKVENVDEVGEGDFVKGNFKGGDLEQETVLPLNKVAEAERNTFLGKKKDETISFDIRKAMPESKDIKTLFQLESEEAADAISGEFELTIAEISRESEAALDAEFFNKILGEKEAEGIEDEAAFKTKIKSILDENNNPNAEYYTEKNIKEILLEKYDFEVNEEFTKKIYTMSNGGEMSEEEMEKNYPLFLEVVKWRAISDVIAEKAEIKVEMDEVKKEAGNIVKQQFMGYNIPMDDAMLDTFADNYLKMEDGKNFEQTYSNVRQKKVFDHIKANINLEEVQLDEKQLKEMVEKERAEMAPEVAESTEEASPETSTPDETSEK